MIHKRLDFSKLDLKIRVILNPTYTQGGESTIVLSDSRGNIYTTIKLSEEQLLDLTCAIRKEAERRVPQFVRKQ